MSEELIRLICGVVERINCPLKSAFGIAILKFGELWTSQGKLEIYYEVRIFNLRLSRVRCTACRLLQDFMAQRNVSQQVFRWVFTS